MNVFGENLQFYRKQKNMTQEQLAEHFDISRQTVSKWEAGTSYPEMEKILQLCDLFSCDMDTLLRKDAAALEIEDSQGYNNHMEKWRRKLTFGITMLIVGLAVYQILDSFQIAETIVNILFLMIVIVAILDLIVAGMQHDIYRKNHQVISNFYSKEEKQKSEEKFPIYIAVGIGIILFGVLIGMNGDEFPLLVGMTSDFYNGIFLILTAIGVGTIVYNGLGQVKYDIEGYNKENNPDFISKKINNKIVTWCGCIMIFVTILFCIAVFVFQLW
ncbi:MAG: helix-turn-helix domain-containing protein [Lachnospiraceae bacterium]